MSSNRISSFECHTVASTRQTNRGINTWQKLERVFLKTTRRGLIFSRTKDAVATEIFGGATPRKRRRVQIELAPRNAGTDSRNRCGETEKRPRRAHARHAYRSDPVTESSRLGLSRHVHRRAPSSFSFVSLARSVRAVRPRRCPALH